MSDPQSSAGEGERIGVAVLGSTGSVGTRTLDVIAQHSDRFRVVALAAGRNAALLTEQARRFRPAAVWCDAEAALDLPGIAVQPMEEMVVRDDVDVVVAATVGVEPGDADRRGAAPRQGGRAGEQGSAGDGGARDHRGRARGRRLAAAGR
jgi:hypothetical protein